MNECEKRVIVALDAMSEDASLALAEKLSGLVWGFKVNDLLLEKGVDIVKRLRAHGSVFADPKLYDIPNTVANSVKRLSDAGADIITVHASAGREALKKASSARGSAEILAITVLTSFTDEDSKQIFKQSAGDAVVSLATFAEDCGVQGVVCSPKELTSLSKLSNNFIRLTPGVRPSWYKTKDDQNRIASPKQAVDDGATYLVIGRPITQSEDPAEAVRKIAEELEKS